MLIEPHEVPLETAPETQVNVYYEDTDAGGVAYHTAYLRWAERARTDMLRAAGVTYAMQEAAQTVYVVSEAYMRVKRPARMDDVIRIVTERFAAKGARLPFRQKAVRVSDGQVLAEMEFIIARVDTRTFKPSRASDLF